jgi:hypothetical protein
MEQAATTAAVATITLVVTAAVTRNNGAPANRTAANDAIAGVAVATAATMPSEFNRLGRAGESHHENNTVHEKPPSEFVNDRERKNSLCLDQTRSGVLPLVAKRDPSDSFR